ncbi:hypothetical protein ILYODFUR_009209 [Ilyodon furcidens]|uniref:Uncharacterized protein n=1 Tax=Ilyodon furcidens TaxID=33524 RepID=A0ABV0TUZ8_9TELE
MGVFPVLGLTALANITRLEIERALPAVVLALEACANGADLGIERPLPVVVVLTLEALADAAVLGIDGAIPAVVLALEALTDAPVLGIEGAIPGVVIALIALATAAALKVKGENRARGHGQCTAPGLGLDLSLHSTTAIFSPIIREVRVLVRDCFYEKEGFRNLAHQERALSYSRLLGQKRRNRGHQGRAVSKDHPQVRAENKCYRGVMKSSAQEGAPIKSCLQEVKRDKVHEDGAVSDDACQERAVSDSCHQEELVTNDRDQ